MNWTSPTTSTVVGSSHSTRTFPCTRWAIFRGPSHPGALVKALALDSPLADGSALVAGMTRTTGLVSPCAMRAVGIEPCLLRLAVNSARPSLGAA